MTTRRRSSRASPRPLAGIRRASWRGRRRAGRRAPRRRRSASPGIPSRRCRSPPTSRRRLRTRCSSAPRPTPASRCDRQRPEPTAPAATPSPRWPVTSRQRQPTTPASRARGRVCRRCSAARVSRSSTTPSCADATASAPPPSDPTERRNVRWRTCRRWRARTSSPRSALTCRTPRRRPSPTALPQPGSAGKRPVREASLSSRRTAATSSP